MQGHTVLTQLYCQIHINISTTCFGPYGQVIASDSDIVLTISPQDTGHKYRKNFQ